MPDFLAWSRPAVHALATTAPAGARLTAALPITLHDAIGDITAPAPFLLAGPGDVEGLHRNRIVGRRPHPGCMDAETTMMPFVEIDAADLPWRYSPVQYVAGGLAVRPWLVLVVGTPQEVRRLADGRVVLSGDVLARHPLGSSFRWAHVQQGPGRSFARIISPGILAEGQDYITALVPAWQAGFAADGSSTLTDSWTVGSGSVTLPCFDSWRFHTTPEPGDFSTIARRLEPLTAADSAQLAAAQFGRAMVEVGPLPGVSLAAGGALTVVPEPGDPPVTDPLPPQVSAALTALSQDLDLDGRWVLTLPRYDTPWYATPVDGQSWSWPPEAVQETPPGWRAQLRADPRFRGAAGLGAWTAIAWQDRISAGATQQAGAVAAAAQRIRHLVLGLHSEASLWRRRVPSDALARLATLSPLLGRMPVTAGGSALQAIAGRTPGLAPALFGSSARWMLRRRGPLQRSAAAGSTALASLLEAANRCEPPQQLSDEDAKVAEAAQKPDSFTDAVDQRLRSTLARYYTAVFADPAQAADFAEALDTDGLGPVLTAVAAQRPPDVDCAPLPDLKGFADSVAAGVDPTAARPVVIDRVLGGITGLREPVLAEPDTAPEIDIPLWSFLRDNAPDWLLPGAGNIPADRVVAVQSNPAFTEALLLGANHQTLGELRWRNLPITSRWTPLRRFWQRIDTVAGKAAPDLQSVIRLDNDQLRWPDASDLGDVSHLADPDQGASLVIVLHTELFRRYPATAVYLSPNAGGAAIWGDVPKVDSPAVVRTYPSFSGTMNPDLVFFGFDVPPAAGRNHWVVLEEPPPGYRFLRPGADGSPDDAGINDAATWASTTFSPPTRVFLGNLL